MNQLQIRDELNNRGLTSVNVVVNQPIPVGINICFAETGNYSMGHYVVVEKHPHGVCLLVDPFGLSNGLRFHVKYLDQEREVYYSNVNGQRLGSKYCALYCIAYCVLRAKGYTQSEAVATLYPDTTKARDNSDVLHRILGEQPNIILERYKPVQYYYSHRGFNYV
jgi:hypothetical protein